ncbi:MAG: Asp-tRNA(Asn)/Glu-tRNA(Gln) amidotransferase subunit GatC [Lactobacillaceae bacterium]|nr:Asp-tRNA(Asn)/Glu-tRNA(Gln) amidotransferase subunit GatC [Lactobacillaceae bacterium]
MSEVLSKDEAKHVASLAKLNFTEEQLDKMVSQLSNILDLVDTLNEVDTNGVEATYSVSNNVNVLREDMADNWQQKDQLINNAPESKDGLIKVPAILDGGDINE